MSWVSQNMTNDTRRTVNTFLGSSSKDSEPKTGRGLLGILTLMIGGALIYTSLPYASAFVNAGKAVSISKLDRKIGQFTSGLTQTSTVKKVYLRQGQGLGVNYRLPTDSTVTLTILQCKSRPIIEVYFCAPVSTQDIVIQNSTVGSRSFRAPQAGFYYFKDTMTSHGQSPYTLLWHRI